METVHGKYFIKIGNGKYVLKLCRICGDERPFATDKELTHHIVTEHSPEQFGEKLESDEEGEIIGDMGFASPVPGTSSASPYTKKKKGEKSKPSPFSESDSESSEKEVERTKKKKKKENNSPIAGPSYIQEVDCDSDEKEIENIKQFLKDNDIKVTEEVIRLYYDLYSAERNRVELTILEFINLEEKKADVNSNKPGGSMKSKSPQESQNLRNEFRKSLSK